MLPPRQQGSSSLKRLFNIPRILMANGRRGEGREGGGRTLDRTRDIVNNSSVVCGASGAPDKGANTTNTGGSVYNVLSFCPCPHLGHRPLFLAK